DRLLRLRNQAAHDLPHLLRWILTEYAISGSAPPGVDGVEDWIDVAQGWTAGERATGGDPTGGWADAETVVTALAPLGRLRQAYAEYVRNNGGTETGIPLTAVAFRRIEHMLTNPATPAGGDASTREVLAAKYMRFLSSPATPGAIDQRDGGQGAGVRDSAAEGAPSDSADSDGPTPLSRAH